MAIADKLQTLINGKQYVIDKVNAKAGSDLKINSTWQSVGDAVEGIQNGGGNTLKKLLDHTKTTAYMFYRNTTITDLTDYINYDDTSNITNMNNMFNSCTSLTTIPTLDTSNVTNMYATFQGCYNLTTIPQLDTSSVTDMRYMFRDCNKLTTIPQLDTSSVTNMSNTFYGCTSLTTISLLDTSSVTEMYSMFSSCTSLTKIDISHYKISSISNSGSWCYYCASLKTIIIRSFGAKYALNSNSFDACYHLTGTVNETYNPNGDKDCYIYVPASMVDTLKSTTNWSTYADQIRALEDYTVDGTTTGELDESKVNA